MHYFKPYNRQLVLKALKKAGREDLIGWGKECLIPPREIKGREADKPRRKSAGKDEPRKPQRKAVATDERRSDGNRLKTETRRGQPDKQKHPVKGKQRR